MGADELSECVQDFYQNLSERLQTQFKGSFILIHEKSHLPFYCNYIVFALCCFVLRINGACRECYG